MNEPVSQSPTQDDRTMAILAHALQLVGGFIAPLIIFFVKRQSRFVSFHALQVLLFQIVHVFFSMVLTVGWVVAIFTTVMRSQAGHSAPPTAFFVLFPVIMVFFMGFWLITLVLAIVFGIKAGGGEWAEYPVLGGLARKILKIGPGGSDLTQQL